MNPEPSILIGVSVRVVWRDHYGVKQNWDEDFPKEAAVITSYGYVTYCNDDIIIVTPHLCHENHEHSCGDMVIVRAAIKTLQPIE